jgi:hypothetical protein
MVMRRRCRVPKGVYTRPVRPLIYVIGPSIVYIPLTCNKFAVIEVEDAVKVARRNWHYDGGAQSNVAKSGGSQTPVKLHRLLMKVKSAKILIDHKNGNPLDNRKCGNLRRADRRQNMFNSKVRCTSKTGIHGVYKRGNGKYGVCVAAKRERNGLGHLIH